jgi:hypothetical protein
MTPPICSSDTQQICGTDTRRQQVRASDTLAGIDYVEVYPDGVTLCVHFFGAMPRQLNAANVVIEGGVRVRDVAVVSVRFHEHDDGDPCLMIAVDKTGDFSHYCVCLIRPSASMVQCSFQEQPPIRRAVPQGIDPRYACASFLFHIDCPNTPDCKPQPCPPTSRLPPPTIDYLARDFESFRRLLLDRLAQTLPQWAERHAPDLGLTLVELLAYVADQLSYQLDAVATEAFLQTARRRISVRRHARLVDYWMHEGCNARAWLTIGTDTDQSLKLSDLAFAAFEGDLTQPGSGPMDWQALKKHPQAVIFEPIQIGASDTLEVIAAHSEMHFHTWQRSACCLPAGSTRATLCDEPPSIERSVESNDDIGDGYLPFFEGDDKGPPYRLRLKPGDVLIFEETRGCATAATADADPNRRHVVCLTRALPTVDPLTHIRIWEIEWHPGDALPFDLRLTVRATPDNGGQVDARLADYPTARQWCQDVPAAVARGNVLLVDHGLTLDKHDEKSWEVGVEDEDRCCLCDGANIELHRQPKRLEITLDHTPLTHAEPLREVITCASALNQRNARDAIAAVCLLAEPTPRKGEPAVDPQLTNDQDWHPVRDLLASGPEDRDFAVEIDDEGLAHLRFGDGLNGQAPAPGWRFRVRSRVGNGPPGNVGHDAIVRIASKNGLLSGVRFMPRNPLPATGGTAPETVEQVKLHAPNAYGRILERAVAAEDYARLAQDDVRVQGAFAQLSWTGSWYEACVSLDTLARYASEDLTPAVFARLQRVRRIGHDLRLVSTRQVPLDIALSICIEPHYLRNEVEQAVLAVLSNRTRIDGSRGMFHPDELGFGVDVSASRIIAAVQALEGVAHVELVTFARLYASQADALRSLEDNLIAIAPDEVAQLDNDPNLPELGRLRLLKGAR